MRPHRKQSVMCDHSRFVEAQGKPGTTKDICSVEKA
jgi:hypothetical protein